MKIDTGYFQVRESEKVKPKKWPSRVLPVYRSKKEYNKLLEQQMDEFSDLQRLHYACNR
jgi:hypothetical protein